MLNGICSEYWCFLSDASGNSVCPYAPGAISYIELTSAESRAKRQRLLAEDRLVCEAQAAVLIKGYVTIAHAAGDYKETLPFSAIATLYLPMGAQGPLTFATGCFSCRLKPRKVCGNIRSAYSRIVIQLEACACAAGCSQSTGPAAISPGDGGRPACAVLRTCVTLLYKQPPIRADICQYNAIAQEGQRVFTNADALTAYGAQGIPSPETVSLCQVYVNGVLQPPSNYDVEKGRLCFKTEDYPAEGMVVSIRSTRLKSSRDAALNAVANYFVAVADGAKTTYTDEDALPQYGDAGIPAPCEVSFFNLFVNGVLQPPPVYSVERGQLTLTEAPKAGQYIILESVIVQGAGSSL